MNCELGTIIKEKREGKKLSQRELAKKVNIDNSIISRIENGAIKKPSYETLKKISNELEIYNEDFFNLLESAKYTAQELKDLGLIIEAIGISGSDKIKQYLYKNEKYNIIDIIKVLQDYKKNKLTESEVIGLFTCLTMQDIFTYIPKELINKYNIKRTFEIK